MSKGTPIRGFRVDDELWQAAIATAQRRGENLADVLRAALRMYADDRHPTMSSEVTAANNAHIDSCPQCQETFGAPVTWDPITTRTRGRFWPFR